LNSVPLATSQPTRAPSGPSNRNGLYTNPSMYYKTSTSNRPPVAGSSYSPQSYYTQSQPQQQHQSYFPNNPPAFIRGLSENTLQSPQAYQQQQYQQYQQSPSLQPHRHRSTRKNRKSSPSTSRSRSPEPYGRHKDLKRTAMRGLLGASAIGGFMDALEAFSII